MTIETNTMIPRKNIKFSTEENLKYLYMYERTKLLSIIFGLVITDMNGKIVEIPTMSKIAINTERKVIDKNFLCSSFIRILIIFLYIYF